MTALETRALLNQLEAAVAENLDRHLASAVHWFTHAPQAPSRPNVRPSSAW